MFCPNCGTQNPDVAQTCSKCNFNLKGAAAPKFKGTMLMMNQPGAPPGVPAAPQAPLGRPGAALQPPPGAGAVPSRLKGTMVGVAPMAGGLGGPFPVPATPAPPAPQALPHAPMGATPLPPPPNYGLGGEAPAGYSPPVPQAGVNPLGGTVAADAGVFGAFAAQQQGAPPGAAGGYAPPPPGQMPGAPPGAALPGFTPPGYPPPYGAAPPYGAPPQQGGQGPQPAGFPPFGVPPPAPGVAPPQGYGGLPPNAYGVPPQEPYGQQQGLPGGGYGQPPMGAPMGAPPGAHPQMGGGMVPYGQQPSGQMIGTLKSQGAAPTGPRRRNALMTLLLPALVIFGGFVLSTVLVLVGIAAAAPLGSLLCLGGAVWYLLLAVQMINELKAVTRSDELAWWPIIVPIYNYYFMWFVVPQQVGRAKQMLGIRQPARHVILYVFLWPFALAADLNDMVR